MHLGGLARDNVGHVIAMECDFILCVGPSSSRLFILDMFLA